MFDLIARLRLQDDFSAKMRKATEQLDKASKKTGILSSGVKKLGGVLAGLGITVGMTAIAKSVISTGVTFDQTMSKVQAVTGAAADEMLMLREQSKQLGRDTVFSASQAADAQAFLGQAGFNTNQILSSMPGLLELASAGALDLGNAADIASNILTGFNLEAEDMGRISDVLAQAAASANTDVQQMGDGMSYVAPIAAAMGISLEEVAASMGLMSDAGIQGERAGTALRGVVAALSDPTTTLTKKLNAAGLSAEDVSPKFNSMADIISNLEGAGFKASDALELVGLSAGPGLAALMTAGSDELVEFTNELENSEGAAKRMSDVMKDNLGGSWNEFMSAVEGVSIEIFEMAEPSLRSFIDGLTDATSKIPDLFEQAKPHIQSFKDTLSGIGDFLKPIVDVFINNFPLIKELIIGAVIAITTFKTIALSLKVISSVVSVFNALRAVFTSTTIATWGLNTALLANPLTWVVVAIAAVVAAGVLLWRNWDTIKEKAIELWDKVSEIFGNIGSWFAEKWGEAKEATANAVSALGEAISIGFETARQWIVDKITQALDFVVFMFTEMPFIIAEKLGFLVGTIVMWISQLPEMFADFFGRARDWAVTFISELPGAIGGFLSDTWSSAVEWLTSIASSFSEWFTTAYNNAIDIVKEIPGAIAGFLAEIPGKVSDIIGTVWEKFKELGSAIPKAIAEGFNAAVGGLGKAAKWAIDKVVGGVSNLASLGSQAASSFGSGYDSATGGSSKSHYHGIDYVPNDGYQTTLHKGEAVITAEENKKRNKGESSVTIEKLADQIIVREDADIDRIAEALYQKINEAGKAGA